MGWSNVAVSVIEVVTVIITTGTANSGIFVYNGTPAAGNLIGSWAAAAGTDTFGNPYPQGIMVGTPANNSQIVIGETGGSPLIYFPTGRAAILNSGAIQTIVQGSGTSQFEQTQILGAEDNTQLDAVDSAWLSSSPDGTQIPKILDFYHDPSGGFHFYRTMTYAGNASIGTDTAVQPGTGVSRATPAVAETWHTMTLIGVFTAGPSPFPAPRYRLETQGGGKVVRLSGAVQLTANSGGFTTFWDAPAGYQVTFGQHFSVATKTAAGANGQNVISTTNVTPWQVELANAMLTGDIFYLDGITFVLD